MTGPAVRARVAWIALFVAACNADGYQAEEACDQAIKLLVSGL